MSFWSNMGITPKTPIEVRITLGRQPPGRLGAGFPVAKDRFWLCVAVADGVKVPGRSGEDRLQRYLPLAPGFAAFNEDPYLAVEAWDGARAPNADRHFQEHLARLPEEQRAEWRRYADAHRAPRRVLRGVFVHRRAVTHHRRGDGCSWPRFSAQEGSGAGVKLGPHPDRRPACMGNGQTAERWVNEPDQGWYFKTIPCPGDGCPLRADGTGARGQGVACQKVMSVIFQLRWEGKSLPCSLAELELGGSYNHAADSLSGLFTEVERQWAALGLPGEADFYGLPFKAQLVHKTGDGKAFWTVLFSLDLPHGDTIQGWAIKKAQDLADGRRLLADQDVPLIAAAEGPGEAWSRTRYFELAASPQSLPGGAS